MKLFDNIKRRARDVIRAAKGEPWGDLVRMPEVKRTEAKVETFVAERYIGPLFDNVPRAAVLESYRRSLAADLARQLQGTGILTEEVRQDPHELGHLGYTMRMTVRVVVPEEGVRE